VRSAITPRRFGNEVSPWTNLDAWTDNPEEPDSALYGDRRGADGAMLLKGEGHPDPGWQHPGEFEVEFDSVLQFPENRQAAPLDLIERPVHVTGRFLWTPPCQPMSLKEQGEDLLRRMKLDPEWRQKFGEERKK